MQLARTPSGGALVLAAQVLARDLTLPITAHGRALVVRRGQGAATASLTQLDGSFSEHRYGVVQDDLLSIPVRYDDLLDANRHRTQWRSDALGRLRRVDEIRGNCGYWGFDCPQGTSDPNYWAIATRTRYTYSATDQLTGVTAPLNNLTSLSYDSLARKTGMTDPDMGTWAYQYDPNGNLTRQTDARGQRVCLYYDALDRLTGKHYRTDDSCPATQPANPEVRYGYDAGTYGTGRRTSMASAAASTSRQYDQRGRRTRASHTLAGGTRTFDWSYDSADRVRTLTYPPIGAAARETLTYGYDADGERVKKTRGGGTTIALEGLWEEVVGSPAAAKSSYGFNGQVVAFREGAGAPLYLASDHLGSAQVVMNGAGGVEAAQEYDPWDAVRPERGAVTQTSRNFTGQMLDGTGLLYYHARSYDPALGRFLSPDPGVPGAGRSAGRASGGSRSPWPGAGRSACPDRRGSVNRPPGPGWPPQSSAS